MAKPWKTIESIETEEGILELHQRDQWDFLITLGGLVLMNSMAHRSEVALGQLGCKKLRTHPAPRVLVGGLGMGFTLRAVLDSLPATARVVVAELNLVVLKWCRGPLKNLTEGAVEDPRVTVKIIDVAALVRQAASGPPAERFDAVIFDLYKGPHFHTDTRQDPLYGRQAIAVVRAALKPAGTFAVWGENYDEGFSTRLKSARFKVSTQRPGRGGLRHVVFVAEAPLVAHKPSTGKADQYRC